MTETTLALAPTSPPTAHALPLGTDNLCQPTTQPSLARLLIVSNDPEWLREALALVPDDCGEVECLTHDGFSDSLVHLTQKADLIVLLGSVAGAGQEPWGLSSMPADKPLVWLPIPSNQPADTSTDQIWRKSTAVAMRTAIRHFQRATQETPKKHQGASDIPLLDASRGELREGELRVRVTPTECNLLRVLLASRGCWIPAAELRMRAFGPDHACHDSLIRVHVYKLRRKLECMTAEIRSAKGRGYMFA